MFNSTIQKTQIEAGIKLDHSWRVTGNCTDCGSPILSRQEFRTLRVETYRSCECYEKKFQNDPTRPSGVGS